MGVLLPGTANRGGGHRSWRKRVDRSSADVPCFRSALLVHTENNTYAFLESRKALECLGEVLRKSLENINGAA